MADEPKPKNPERYYKREQIFFQHPAVRDMGKLSDALKEGPEHDAARDALHIESIKGPEDETHYGRIRRLNNEWNADHPIHREHKVELTPWEKKPYNERALHHVQFGIPNGGGAMKTTPHDELIVRTHSYKNDDGTHGHYTKLEQAPEGWSMVEAVGKALGEHPSQTQARLHTQPGGYPKDFNKPDTRAVGKEMGYDAMRSARHEDPDPFNRTRRN
jgi:hypothetical protein